MRRRAIALEQDPTIATVLALGRRSPVICFGMGALAPDFVLVQSGFITTDEASRAAGKGAVGDILSRYIDASGQVVDPELDARTIGLELRYCADREFSIGVGGGGGETCCRPRRPSGETISTYWSRTSRRLDSSWKATSAHPP